MSPCGGGRRYCHINMGYIGMCRCEEYGFQAVYSGKGYINQRVWFQNRVSFSRKQVNWLKILFQNRETWNCHSKIQKKKIGFVLAGLCQSPQWFLENSYSGMGRGWGFGEFSLVLGQQNSREQALVQTKGARVPAAHPHSKITKLPPPPFPQVMSSRYRHLFSVACPTRTTHFGMFSFFFSFFLGGGGGWYFFNIMENKRAISSVFLISIFTQMSIEITAFWKECVIYVSPQNCQSELFHKNINQYVLNKTSFSDSRKL